MITFRQNIVLFFILFFSLNFLFAQDYNSVVNKRRDQWHGFIHQRFYVSNEIRNDSVAFFKEVEKLRKVATDAGDKQLMLEADFLKYNFLSSRDYPFYLEEINLLKDEVNASGIKQLQARIYQAIGLHYFYEAKDYAMAVEKIGQSYVFIQNLTQADLPDKQELLYNIAFMYYQVDYYNAALEYISLAENEPTKSYYPQLRLLLLNLKGIIYKNKEDWDNAILTFNKVYENALNEKEKTWQRVAKNNLAEIYYRQNSFKNALQNLNWTLEANDNQEIIEILLKKNKLLALIYIKTNNIEGFSKAVEEIEQLLVSVTNKDEINRFDQLLHLRAYSKKIKGDYEQAYVLMDSALMMTQREHTIKNTELIERYSYKEAIQKYNHEKSALENQKKTNIIVWIGAISIVILLIIIFITLIQKQKLLHKQKKVRLELEKQLIKNELENASEKLKEITLSLLEKNEQIQQIQKELELIGNDKVKDNDSKERVAYLNSLLSRSIITPDRWLQFKRAFENVHKNFIENLKIKMPELTESEIRYIVLRKLNLTSKEIASILGIQFDTVRLYKYRIKKKCDIDDEVLEDIISGL